MESVTNNNGGNVPEVGSLEEKLNTASHAFGVLFGLIGLPLLLLQSSDRTAYTTFSICLYSASFIMLFGASTMYHYVSQLDLKRKFRILDHISIYFLIAGTYTPVALISLENSHGWILFYTVWGIAAIGTVLKLFFTGRYEVISLLLYLVMGWLIVIDFSALQTVTSDTGITLLFGGGLFYTLGIVFYAVSKIPYNHFIWHLFVLAGSICHWFFIYNDVV